MKIFLYFTQLAYRTDIYQPARQSSFQGEVTLRSPRSFFRPSIYSDINGSYVGDRNKNGEAIASSHRKRGIILFSHIKYVVSFWQSFSSVRFVKTSRRKVCSGFHSQLCVIHVLVAMLTQEIKAQAMRYLRDMSWKLSCACSHLSMTLLVVAIVGGYPSAIDQEVFIVVYANRLVRFIGMGSASNGMVECSPQLRVDFQGSLLKLLFAF